MERYRFTEQEKELLEHLQQPLAVYQFIDRRVVTLALSDGFCRLFGYTDREEAVRDMDHDMYRDTHPDDAGRVADAAVRFAEEDEPYDVVYRSRAKDGPGYRVIHARGEHVFTENGIRLAHVWYMDEGTYAGEDVSTDFQRSDPLNQVLTNALHEASILKSSRYDSLTGLPSMNYFFELAEAEKQAMTAAGEEAVLMYLDLNGMKYFNHRNGFAEGDRLLRAFAGVMARVFSHENCCHIGADRFAACSKKKGLEEQLRLFFQEAGKINGGNSLPVRVGIYPVTMEDVPVSMAYDRAKIACDTVRKTDASGFRYYNDRLRNEIRRRQYIQTHIDQAIAEKWIQVYYQPIVRAVSGKVCDEEALARWIDPSEGFLSPAEFIPYLEDGGMIYKLDLYVLEQVLEKIRNTRREGLSVVPHSINLSRSDFDACDMVEEIRKRVDDAGVSRDRISIEITESVIGSDADFIREQIVRFRELGFPVWMDDFGSGYSSLDVLQSIPFDLVKFDMSFMRKLDEGEKGRIILTNLMKMATSLQLDTVCEGVETEAQAHFLLEIGCSKLQGYHYCRPIPYSEILERNRLGIQIGYEDPSTSGYYSNVGQVNLYDPGMIAGDEENLLHNTFDTIPMGIIEIRGETSRVVRCNQAYRDFMGRRFGIDLSNPEQIFRPIRSVFMRNMVKACRDQGGRMYFDETLPDGFRVHSFARRIASSPLNGTTAVLAAVLSQTEPDEETSYVDIARALAADYYNIYVVDLDTERFIEYSSPVGKDVMAAERHGVRFFDAAREATAIRIYQEDRKWFVNAFTRENVLRELERFGVFTRTYRLIDTGTPTYATMKLTRMPGGNRIILGVSLTDCRERQEAKPEKEAVYPPEPEVLSPAR